MPTITFYTYEYPPICGTGPGNTIRLLSSKLIGKGFKLNVVTFKFGKYSHLKKEEHENNADVYRLQLPMNERLLFSVRAGIFSWTNKKKIKSDLIHAMDSRISTFIHKNKTPIITNVNDYVPSSVHLNPFKKYPWHSSDKIKRYFYENTTKFFEFLSFRKSDLIIMNSEYTNKNVASYYHIPKEKTRTIYKGVDLSEFKHEKMEKNVDLLFVGGNIEMKGIRELINAVATIREEFKNIRVVAVGRCSSNHMSHLKRLTDKLGVSENIQFAHNMPHNELANHYSRSKIFVMPTYREALGQTILEAMAARLPVISTQVGGVPEIVNEKNGFLVPAYDSKELAEKIRYLLSNPEKAKKMGEEGYKTVAEHFTIQKMVDRYIKTYEELI